MSLDIKCYCKGLYGENTYLVTDKATGEMAIVDPGYYGADVKRDIGDGDKLRYLLLTHCHEDHYLAAGQYFAAYPQLKLAAAENERYLLGKSECPEPDIWLKEGDTITLGETVFKVIETPGHTEGCICFMTDDEIFSGDTLFKLSVGRTDLETGDWFTILHSIKDKLYTLDEDLTVYAGHGVPTKIGYEKRKNPFV